MEDYFTLQKQGQVEFTEKKSRFIGYAAPVSEEKEAIAFIGEIRARHREARHNVYAYLINSGGMVNQRYSDDGEPQGTGGYPVLEVIQKRGLVNCCIVVTRYFGGVLLGASGLVRAYSRGASAAVEAAGVLQVVKCVSVQMALSYSQYDRISAYMAERGFALENSVFTEQVALAYAVPAVQAEAVVEQLTELTSGRIQIWLSDSSDSAGYRKIK